MPPPPKKYSPSSFYEARQYQIKWRILSSGREIASPANSGQAVSAMQQMNNISTFFKDNTLLVLQLEKN